MAEAWKQAEHIVASCVAKTGAKPVRAILETIREKIERMKGELAGSRPPTTDVSGLGYFGGLRRAPLEKALELIAEVAELATLEVLQHRDLDPLNEGARYAQLLRLPGYSPAKIAERTGKTCSDVNERLKLVASCADCANGTHRGWSEATHRVAPT